MVPEVYQLLHASQIAEGPDGLIPSGTGSLTDACVLLGEGRPDRRGRCWSESQCA